MTGGLFTSEIIRVGITFFGRLADKYSRSRKSHYRTKLYVQTLYNIQCSVPTISYIDNRIIIITTRITLLVPDTSLLERWTSSN